MWLLNIIAFLIVTIYLTYKTKETMAEILPVTACGLIMVLYVLAYFRCLSWIDGISVGIVGGSLYVFCRQEKEKRKHVYNKTKQILLNPVTIMIAFTIIGVCLCVQGRIVLWWDDINFWATDVKSIYYLKGFAGKYGNAAPEFGDYPPGVQLFKWWFLHFQPEEFKEGMMFAGYYTLNILLLAPLFSGMNKVGNKLENLLQYFLGGICLFAFPSVVETFYLEGTCSDLPMAIAYGLFLWSVIDEKKHSLKFSYARQSLTLALVMICKNTGFQWVIYGMIFWILYHWIIYRENRREILIRFLGISFLPVIVEGSWLISCLIKRRVAKLTGAGIKMAVSGELPGVDYRPKLLESFIQGFVAEPIHRMDTPLIDLSVMAVIVLGVILLYFGKKKKVYSQKQYWLLLGYFIVTAMVSYGLTLIAHMTIFVTELQYLEAVVMTASIERYGSPFTVGMLYVLWQTLLSRREDEKTNRYLAAMVLVCLCVQWPGVYNALAGYRTDVGIRKEERAAMIEDEAELFAEKTEGIWKEKGARVLYLRDGSTNHSVKDTYINYEVSPLGVVYGNISEALFQKEYCRQLIEQSHAAYLYADAVEIESELLFEDLTEKFRYETLYKIEKQEGNIKLVLVQ